MTAICFILNSFYRIDLNFYLPILIKLTSFIPVVICKLSVLFVHVISFRVFAGEEPLCGTANILLLLLLKYG